LAAFALAGVAFVAVVLAAVDLAALVAGAAVSLTADFDGLVPDAFAPAGLSLPADLVAVAFETAFAAGPAVRAELVVFAGEDGRGCGSAALVRPTAFRAARTRSAILPPDEKTGARWMHRALQRLARIRNVPATDKHATPVGLFRTYCLVRM
jgi:hypothetical protein